MESPVQGARRYGSNEAEPIDWIVPPAREAGKANASSGARGPASSIASRAASIPGISEMFAYHATTMANTIRTSLLVFTRKVRLHLAAYSSTDALPASHPVHGVDFLHGYHQQPGHIDRYGSWHVAQSFKPMSVR
jgi:hypothetical protein